MCFRRISNSFGKKNTFGIRCPPNQTSQRISHKDRSMSHIERSLPQNTEHTWNFGAMQILTNIRRIRKHRLRSVCSRRRHSERIRENRFWSVHLRRCHIRIRRYISHSFPHIFVEGPQHWEKRKRALLCALYCLRLTWKYFILLINYRRLIFLFFNFTETSFNFYFKPKSFISLFVL